MRLPIPKLPKSKLLKTSIAGIALITAFNAVTMTGENEVKLTTAGGKITGTTSLGFGVKIPFYETTYGLKTDAREIKPEDTSASLQNGAITAKNIKSSAFVRLNGTREQQEETVKLIYKKMKDFDSRVKSLAEKSLRDVVRQTIVASADSDEKQEVTAENNDRLDFLDSAAIGEAVKTKLQNEINNIVKRKINIGTDENPEMVDAIEVTSFKVGNFEWDEKYETRRDDIAQARARAEQARFKKAEEERNADAARAAADGRRDAAKKEADGQEYAIRRLGEAEADAITKRINAAGGAEELVKIIRAERWNGWEDLQVLAGGDAQTIVDAREKKTAAIPQAALQ